MSSSLVDRPKIEAALIVFSTVFDMALANAPTIYDQIATVIPNSGERIEFKWLGGYPTMQRWIGDRPIAKLRGESFALTTDWWANGLGVDVDDLNKPFLFGLITKRIASLALAGQRRIDDEVIQYYINGFTAARGVTYDGQFLFDVDHTAAGNGTGVSQSNLLTGPVSSAQWNAGIQRAYSFVDDKGEPIQVRVPRLLYGPGSQLLVRQLFDAERLASGASNVDYNKVPDGSRIMSPRIPAASTMWVMLSDDDTDVRPVIVGVEVPPTFVAADNPMLWNMFSQRQALYGAHLKFGTTYGMWQPAVGSAG